MYTLYVGADNETGELNTTRIGEIVTRYGYDYTLLRGEGSYGGKFELCAVVQIVTERTPTEIQHLARQVAREMVQHSVLVMHSMAHTEFVKAY